MAWLSPYSPNGRESVVAFYISWKKLVMNWLQQVLSAENFPFGEFIIRATLNICINLFNLCNACHITSIFHKCTFPGTWDTILMWELTRATSVCLAWLLIGMTSIISQIAKLMGSTWGSHGSCGHHVGPMLAPWTLLSGITIEEASLHLLEPSLLMSLNIWNNEKVTL